MSYATLFWRIIFGKSFKCNIFTNLKMGIWIVVLFENYAIFEFSGAMILVFRFRARNKSLILSLNFKTLQLWTHLFRRLPDNYLKKKPPEYKDTHQNYENTDDFSVRVDVWNAGIWCPPSLPQSRANLLQDCRMKAKEVEFNKIKGGREKEVHSLRHEDNEQRYRRVRGKRDKPHPLFLSYPPFSILFLSAIVTRSSSLLDNGSMKSWREGEGLERKRVKK